MEILTLFMYLITGTYTLYYIIALLHITVVMKERFKPSFIGLVITAVAWSATIALYVGGN